MTPAVSPEQVRAIVVGEIAILREIEPGSIRDDDELVSDFDCSFVTRWLWAAGIECALELPGNSVSLGGAKTIGHAVRRVQRVVDQERARLQQVAT